MNLKTNTANKTLSYTIASFYNSYLDNIEPDTMYDIDYKLYRAIVIDYFKHLRLLLLYHSRNVKLPYRLGTVLIVKHKPLHYDSRSLRIDYKSTKEYNKLVFLTNEHSNYYKYRCHWDKTNILTKNKSYYLLNMTRANKRELALIIKNKICDYLEL